MVAQVFANYQLGLSEISQRSKHIDKIDAQNS